jgi:toxin ParE1/3/4
MRNIVFGPHAQRDLQEAWDYIATDNVLAADKLVDEVRRALQLLAEVPSIGHQRKDVVSSRYRCWTVRPYVIVYRFSSRTLTVIRVLHGKRDFRGVFGQSDIE